MVIHRCPMCNGSGKRTIPLGDQTTSATFTSSCDACGGRGWYDDLGMNDCPFAAPKPCPHCGRYPNEVNITLTDCGKEE